MTSRERGGLGDASFCAHRDQTASKALAVESSYRSNGSHQKSATHSKQACRMTLPSVKHRDIAGIDIQRKRINDQS